MAVLELKSELKSVLRGLLIDNRFRFFPQYFVPLVLYPYIAECANMTPNKVIVSKPKLFVKLRNLVTHVVETVFSEHFKGKCK